ncbi:hypothetical protein SU9_033670 [Streptomyces auratus AGR0001]|uniref:Uncharacterized protein n=1 Tax=Streptomyces auratus AGR0001 TaxID=1160718 RepID=J1ZMA8_9ACTN|nr:hypothetical protein SU9_033670 [Streptomyces auratus AGR0001]
MPSVATPTASEDCCAVPITPLPTPARSAAEHDPKQHREREALAQPGQQQTGEQVHEPRVDEASALPVAELRSHADALAREICEVDVRIQRTNGEVDLLD